MNPPVSVIIPSYQGGDTILRLLEFLERQSHSDFETIVVIDGSTDGTEKTIQTAQLQLNPLLSVSQGNRGRASARNLGASMAAGELLIFLDEDTQPDTFCVEKHLMAHRNKKKALVFGNVADLEFDGMTDFQRFKMEMTQKWIKDFPESPDTPLDIGNLHLTAANFSISKELFRQLGGFDENLRDAEDFEFAVRAYLNQSPIYFDKSITALHYDPISCSAYLRRQKEYKEANHFLISSSPNPEFFRDRYRDPHLLGKSKRSVFSLFSDPIWIKMADRAFLGLLPKWVRYKLYDLIITGNLLYHNPQGK